MGSELLFAARAKEFRPRMSAMRTVETFAAAAALGVLDGRRAFASIRSNVRKGAGSGLAGFGVRSGIADLCPR